MLQQNQNQMTKHRSNGNGSESLVLEAEQLISKNGNGDGKAKLAKAAKVKEVSEPIELPKLDLRQTRIKIQGISQLIVNRFDEKSQQQILDKQTKKATKGREAKNPDEQYKRSMYKLSDGKKTGFPAVGFKAAMTRAGKLLGLPMTDTRGMFHVVPDDMQTGLVEIKGKHEMRQDYVRLANGVADIRFRAEYQPGWTAEVMITYNASVISTEQLANLLNHAGFSCGIGEWRPEKSNSGSYGLFRVV